MLPVRPATAASMAARPAGLVGPEILSKLFPSRRWRAVPLRRQLTALGLALATVGFFGWLIFDRLGDKLPSLVAVSRETVWSNRMEEGDKAFRRGDYRHASTRYASALKQAEKWGDKDPRLELTLRRLADSYRLIPDAEKLEKVENRLECMSRLR